MPTNHQLNVIPYSKEWRLFINAFYAFVHVCKTFSAFYAVPLTVFSVKNNIICQIFWKALMMKLLLFHYERCMNEPSFWTFGYGDENKSFSHSLPNSIRNTRGSSEQVLWHNVIIVSALPWVIRSPLPSDRSIAFALLCNGKQSLSHPHVFIMLCGGWIKVLQYCWSV